MQAAGRSGLHKDNCIPEDYRRWTRANELRSCEPFIMRLADPYSITRRCSSISTLCTSIDTSTTEKSSGTSLPVATSFLRRSGYLLMIFKLHYNRHAALYIHLRYVYPIMCSQNYYGDHFIIRNKNNKITI